MRIGAAQIAMIARWGLGRDAVRFVRSEQTFTFWPPSPPEAIIASDQILL
jgi:hypothetical protein